MYQTKVLKSIIFENFVKIKLNLEYTIDDNVEETMFICYNYQNVNYRKEKKIMFYYSNIVYIDGRKYTYALDHDNNKLHH